MAKVYYKILVDELTENIIIASGCPCVLTAKKTLVGDYIMLSFEHYKVPSILLTNGYTAMSVEEARAEVAGVDWEAP